MHWHGKVQSILLQGTEKNALKCMHHLHLEDIGKKSFRDLSGGQQQRVLIARALCATDKLLLLDEPVTGLDAVVTAEMYDLIDHLNKVHNVTIIMISHDISNSMKHANKILHISSHSAFSAQLRNIWGRTIIKR